MMQCRVCKSLPTSNEGVFTLHNRKFDAAISFLCDECGNYFCTETNMSKKAHDETYSNNHVWAKKARILGSPLLYS